MIKNSQSGVSKTKQEATLVVTGGSEGDPSCH